MLCLSTTPAHNSTVLPLTKTGALYAVNVYRMSALCFHWRTGETSAMNDLPGSPLRSSAFLDDRCGIVRTSAASSVPPATAANWHRATEQTRPS